MFWLSGIFKPVLVQRSAFREFHGFENSARSAQPPIPTIIITYGQRPDGRICLFLGHFTKEDG
jgi:hypothetical protein